MKMEQKILTLGTRFQKIKILFIMRFVQKQKYHLYYYLYIIPNMQKIGELIRFIFYIFRSFRTILIFNSICI